jgi:type I restriction enzyme M protein
MNSNLLVHKIWALCQTLRDDGVSYGDYLQQLTSLLFLKMVEEVSDMPARRPIIPASLGWDRLTSLTGAALQEQYEADLQRLGQMPGMLGAIFERTQNRIDDPAKLRHLIRVIDEERWIDLNEDVKGDLYEGLLQRNAEDVKSGAGQYFTPRPLIEAMVECLQPQPMKRIADPACGTGGFFLGAYNWLTRPEQQLTKRQAEFLRHHTFVGNEIVAETRRLALMNLLLHGVGDIDEAPNISRSDALAESPKSKVHYVFANPPFGRKSNLWAARSGEAARQDEKRNERNDFWEKTSNKQVNFIQHIVSMLEPDGKAAVVVPDNVLFEGGSGARVRRKLLEKAYVHTMLRLPSGIFYASGVQANVLFFDMSQKAVEDNAKDLWIYDLRTGSQFTRIRNPLRREHLDDFVRAYSPRNLDHRKESLRFRCFSYKEVIARPSASLDISWPHENEKVSNGLAHTVELQREIVEHLRSALTAFEQMTIDAG